MAVHAGVGGRRHFSGGVHAGRPGATVLTAEGTVHVPVRPVPDIVDINGAGDAFLAGFLAATWKGHDPEGAMEAEPMRLRASRFLDRHLGGRRAPEP